MRTGSDPRLEDAAATLGAPPRAAFRRVTPLLLPGMLSALLFAAVVSFDELLVSLFVSTARVRPVPVQMWSNLRGDFDPTWRPWRPCASSWRCWPCC